MADAAPSPKGSDLGVRTGSAVVMLVVLAFALWRGGWVLSALVGLVGLGLLWEYAALVRRFALSPARLTLWMAGGVAYIGAACISLVCVPAGLRLLVILGVIATDTGAYFAGRAFGGPKIAPAISPSKTWAGLYGGMAGAALVMAGAWLLVASAVSALSSRPSSFGAIVTNYPLALVAAVMAGGLLAIFAQTGDFFESWMKRRAGVKDSGSLIPGHGGLFDRVDGLLPVAIVAGILSRLTMA